MPLLLGVAVLVYGVREWRLLGAPKGDSLCRGHGRGFSAAYPALGRAQCHYLAQGAIPRAPLCHFPGEYAPVGFYAWTGTWLERYRDIYFTIWAVSEDRMDINNFPNSAFDSPEEKAQVADLIAQYNESSDLEISPEVDRQFAEIARKRTRRDPLRTYVQVPFERALTIWFTPRTELLPIDGKFFPVRERWEDSHADVLVTGSFALLGYLYVALAAGGVWVAWRAAGGLSCEHFTTGPEPLGDSY